MTEEFRVLGIKAEFSESLWAWLLTSYAEKSQQLVYFLAASAVSTELMNIPMGNNTMTEVNAGEKF